MNGHLTDRDVTNRQFRDRQTTAPSYLEITPSQHVLRRMTDADFQAILELLQPLARAEAVVHREQTRKNDPSYVPLTKVIRARAKCSQGVACLARDNALRKAGLREG